jgi:hypothetical protein
MPSDAGPEKSSPTAWGNTAKRRQPSGASLHEINGLVAAKEAALVNLTLSA